MSCEVRKLLGRYQSQLKSYVWITINQKKLLIECTGSCQVNFFVLSLTQNPLHLSRLIELFLHNLLFQMYVVEFLSWSIRYGGFGPQNCFVKNNMANKSKWLGKLKYFKCKNALSLKRITMASANKRKQWRNIYSIADLLIQQLFILVLNSRVKANTELNNYNLKKHKILIKDTGKIRNGLVYKLLINSEMLEHTSLDMCFHLLSYILLLKNICVPLKYEYIFKSWSCVKQVKYPLMRTNKNNLKMFSIEIIGFLWLNSIFNEIYRLIHGIVIKSKTIICENFLRKFSSNALRLSLQSKLLGDVFVKRSIRWDFFWGIKSFVVLSNSRKFLSFLVRKVQSFLLSQNLKVQTNICRIIWVRANINFHSLCSIFSRGTVSKIVKKWLFDVTNKVHRFQLQRKSIFIHINFSEFFCSMLGAVSWNCSVYNIISVLNSIVIKWMDYFMLNFQKIGGFVQFWLCQWLLFGIKRQYGKKFKIFLSKYSLFIKYFGFYNHFETLRHLTKIKCIFVTRFFFFGFAGILKKNFKNLYNLVPKITAIWSLPSF